MRIMGSEGERGFPQEDRPEARLAQIAARSREIIEQMDKLDQEYQALHEERSRLIEATRPQRVDEESDTGSGKEPDSGPGPAGSPGGPPAPPQAPPHPGPQVPEDQPPPLLPETIIEIDEEGNVIPLSGPTQPTGEGAPDAPQP